MSKNEARAELERLCRIIPKNSDESMALMFKIKHTKFFLVTGVKVHDEFVNKYEQEHGVI